MTDLHLHPSLREPAQTSKAWPFEEARKLIKRYPDGKPGGAPVLFETGYGPSGLPHIGTFNEVLRTTMVRRAYETLTGGAPTRLVAFSDDMDGLRKVPDNVPQQEMLREHLGKPLTAIPDPFGKYESFAHHNNAMLREFLDRFGFEYEFVSSTERYRSGAFDDALKNVLRHNQDILDIMLPTLREERRQTYSPFLPLCPDTGRVLMVPVTPLDVSAGTIAYTHPDTGAEMTTPVTGGACKLQWKADWAMRWTALGVDYEMAGKDLSESVKLSSRIANALGAQAPEGFSYELFLDENGEKISKSRGNGLTIEEWLTYAPPE
ncbi:lysine--tRNA ligase, partial [uncultured Sphingopyxis sp.]|uniref:lysine--tRNA ligase n=1 Tax=uncultured Sphingopyxis sp. TaxID=310581 RepID=UPI002598C9D4